MCPEPPGSDESKGAIATEERRRYVRVRSEVKLNLRLIGRPPKDETAAVRNLGTGGLLVSTQKPLAVGTRLQIQMAIESSGVEFSVGGRVVWNEFNAVTSRHEAGICFVGLDPTQRQNVTALVGTDLHEAKSLERRRFVRLPRRIMAEYRVGAKLLHRWRTGFTRNISMGGVALLTDRKFAVGASVALRIHLEDMPKQALVVGGVVLNSKHQDNRPREWVVHVAFRAPDKAVRERLASYISKMLSAPPIDSVTRPGGEGATKG